MIRAASAFIQKSIHIAPLVVFRITIGAMLILSTLRFLALDWVADHYTEPLLHFSYFGFDWLPQTSAFILYLLHAVMIFGAIGVILGWYYRLSAVLLFLSFTYVELIDLTYYLNHYYFVSLVLFLLIFAPAHRYFSIDSRRRRLAKTHTIPRFWIFQFQLLIGIVYTYAGLAKINRDWLIEALPMKIWLPAADAIPVLGPFFGWDFAPILFSWAGMIYDCTIVWWLAWRVSRPWAFISVIVFHILTGLLFQIGVFPVVMIGAATIFFSSAWHRRILTYIAQFAQALCVVFPKGRAAAKSQPTVETEAEIRFVGKGNFRPVGKPMLVFAMVFFAFQLIFPWRYLLYPGNVFWTEEGYRFSWRVMLMEKAGTATFYVKDAATGREGIVVNAEFLNPHQEKQMAMQPDLILQFAHFLGEHYSRNGVTNPAVRAEVYVTLNARPSQLLIDPKVDLLEVEDGWAPKSWILPPSP